ncbi:MAG: tRNA preQ1(34) S-adenosylmethionine ribosyltransferase-isomerase QueA [Planctomycetes bacterium GWC2_45_44]|nr:MAG: tRNA preQ1(34) S-adenosylmethionine ribosyltransferase-isomerase QueA [Planctomycetes bacterium GWC2_45_44]HBR18732.1 tRNA preQ1(34) S-adenosylmethionine ribosyltransferase-isomerase QueA [Phycisphaerales bacterium]
MDIEELNYDLPAELIAQKPAETRDASKLLILNRLLGCITDTAFSHVVDYLNKGDCLVINDTKVLPAKFFARRKTGAKIEGLFLEQHQTGWLVMLKNSAKIKQGETLDLLDRDKKTFCAAVPFQKLDAGQWLLQPQSEMSAEDILVRVGFSPLPPYIKRVEPAIEHKTDSARYQTVYARQAGAVAAPTAGLHFTQDILNQIRQKQIAVAQITLHVGEGTFLPVKTRTLEEHKIHSERFSLNEQNAKIINDTIDTGGRIIAVGTTTVRTLETVAIGGKVLPRSGQTDIFITPGYEFKIIDGIITNFHLPKSTLLALVGAFAGLDKIMAAYRHAIEKSYRFYSYGDCMLIV